MFQAQLCLCVEVVSRPTYCERCVPVQFGHACGQFHLTVLLLQLARITRQLLVLAFFADVAAYHSGTLSWLPVQRALVPGATPGVRRGRAGRKSLAV